MMLRLLVTLLMLCLSSASLAAEIETGDATLDGAFEQLLDRDQYVESVSPLSLEEAGARLETETHP